MNQQNPPNSTIQIVSQAAVPQPVPNSQPTVVEEAPTIQIAEAPTMQEVLENTDEVVEYVDPNVVQLSTGIVVRFKTLPKAISDEFVTTIFGETELDSNNNIRVATEDRGEQVRLAGEFMKLNTSIIGAGGVELISELPADEDWLEQLQFSPTIMQKYPHINPVKPSRRAKLFLFLRYFAFGDDDLHLLSERCLNQGEG